MASDAESCSYGGVFSLRARDYLIGVIENGLVAALACSGPGGEPWPIDVWCAGVSADAVGTCIGNDCHWLG